MKKISGLCILAALCLMISPMPAKAGGSVSFSVSYSSGDYYPVYTPYRAYDYYDCYRTGYVIVEPLVRYYPAWYPNYGHDVYKYSSYPRRVTYYRDGPYVYSPIYSRVVIFDHSYRPLYRYSWDYLGYGYTHSYIGTSFNFSYSSPSYYADPWRYKPWHKRYSWDDRRHDFGHNFRDRNDNRWHDRAYRETRDERRRRDAIDDRFDGRSDRLQFDRQRVDDRFEPKRFDARSNAIRLPESRIDDRGVVNKSVREFQAGGDNDATRSRAILERSRSRIDSNDAVRSNAAERARIENERSATSRLRSLQERPADIRTRSTSAPSRDSSVRAPSSSSSRPEPSVNRPAPSSSRSAPSVNRSAPSSSRPAPSVNRSSSPDASRGRSDSAVSRTQSAQRSRSR